RTSTVRTICVPAAPKYFHIRFHHRRRSTLVPYTTLFRSHRAIGQMGCSHRISRELWLLRIAGAHSRLSRFHCRRLCAPAIRSNRSEEHTSELQSQSNLVCRLLLEKKKIVCQSQL